MISSDVNRKELFLFKPQSNAETVARKIYAISTDLELSGACSTHNSVNLAPKIPPGPQCHPIYRW